MTARLLTLLLVLLACDRLPEPHLEGQHIRLGASPGHEPCAGNLAHMDRFISLLAAELGVTPPTGDDRFTFYWLDQDDFLDLAPCPREVTACAVFGTVYSRAAMLDHELVHLLDYGTATFFGEGFAVAYEGLGADVMGGLPPRVGRRDIWGSLLSVLWFGVDYDDAGAFVAYLLDRHGLAKFQAALPRFPMLASRAGIDRVFREQFGVSLEDSVADFMDGREACPHIAYDRKLMECDVPRIAWDGRHHAEYRRLAADEPDAVGPFGASDLMVLRGIDIPEDGTYDLDIIADLRADSRPPYTRPTLTLVGCGGCDDEPVFHAITGRQRVELRAGRHALRLHSSTAADIRVAWSITRVYDTKPR